MQVKNQSLLTIVIPCYNEAQRLQGDKFTDYLQHNEDIFFLFVNDGSKDATLQVLQDLSAQNSRIYYLDLPINGGKAEAVRQGILYAKEKLDSQYVGFLDADLATPLSEIDNFRTHIKEGEFDIVMGLRLLRLGAKVQRKRSRHLMGRIFATLSSLILQLPVYDTQCGAKLFHTSIIDDLFSEHFITSWLFDIELLFRYRNTYGIERAKTKIYELPLLQWNDIAGSKLKFKDFFKAPYELCKIKFKYK